MDITSLCWILVDETIFDVSRKENWIERVITAASFGTLWCWKLRDENEWLAQPSEALFCLCTRGPIPIWPEETFYLKPPVAEMYPILIDAYYIFTLTVLSLLFPLSFSLLARLSNAEYLLTFPSQPSSPPVPLLLSTFLNTQPSLLHSLVSVITLTVVLHNLACRIFPRKRRGNSSLHQPGLKTGWILLEISVGFGLEDIKEYAIPQVDYGVHSGMLLLLSGSFLVGLYHSMLHWTKTIVRPVIDDTIFGVIRKERWVEKVAITASFGTLWWWKLRDEIGWLVLPVEVKKKLLMGLGMIDTVNWLLYYVTITIGIVMSVKAIVWFGMKVFCEVPECNKGGGMNHEDEYITVTSDLILPTNCLV